VVFPAPLQVPVEIRLADTKSPFPTRVWRQSTAIGDEGMSFLRPLPFEPGRPVRMDFTLRFADGAQDIALTNVLALVDARDPRRVAFRDLATADRHAIRRYVTDRIG
jgi:hypothetical protein